MTRPNFLKLIVSVLICQSAGIAGGFVTFPEISGWYANLDKPFFNPPGWVFGPVWTVLYFMMGIAFYLIWNLEKTPARGFAMKVFVIQLFLNFIWSFLFFWAHSPWAAFTDILSLWAAILLTITAFKKLSPLAGNLLLPYLAWVSFAAILNFSIAILN